MRISDWSSDVCSSDLLKRETGAEVISAPVSLVRARPNLARCRMLRFRSGMAGLRLGKFQILAPPRHHCGGRLRVKSSQRSEEHTSELQSLMRISYAIFCWKKQKTYKQTKSYETTQQKS